MKRHRKHVKVNIKRAGNKAEILRASGGTENGYGKVTDSSSSWGPVETTYAVPSFDSGDTFQEQTVTGGTQDINTPVFRFPYDSVVQSEDRIIYEGIEYEAKSVAPYSTHKVAQVVSVDG